MAVHGIRMVHRELSGRVRDEEQHQWGFEGLVRGCGEGKRGAVFAQIACPGRRGGLVVEQAGFGRPSSTVLWWVKCGESRG